MCGRVDRLRAHSSVSRDLTSVDTAATVGSEGWVSTINFVGNFNYTVQDAVCSDLGTTFLTSAASVSASVTAGKVQLAVNSSAYPTPPRPPFYVAISSFEGYGQVLVTSVATTVGVYQFTGVTNATLMGPLYSRFFPGSTNVTVVPTEWVCPASRYGDG